MFNKKNFFISFEGIEGSGKTYQSQKLFKKIKSLGYPVIKTREPGGTKSAEIIRNIILTGKKNKFTETTDTLLYLAARNEHIEKILKPAILRKKYIICDRFVDSTFAYQVYGKNVSKLLVDNVHKSILNNIQPDLTFILKLNIKKAFERIKKRKKLNRYDKFSKNFYQKVQNAFIKISKTNSKYVLIDASFNNAKAENIIYKKFLDFYKNEKKK
jgi:dTMP kinase